MSTSNAYSKNKLADILKNKTEHFILKSYITAAFEHERKEPEYHLYWYNKYAGQNPEHPSYLMLSHKRMGKKEFRMFLSMLHDYVKCNDCDDGCVWEHKTFGFNKNKVKLTEQMKLF
jgi:hypothetical protein